MGFALSSLFYSVRLSCASSVSSIIVTGLSAGDKSAGHIASGSSPVQASAPSSLPPYYAEYDYGGYEPQGTFSSSASASALDRQASIEAVLGAPVVITAFAAALFGGILSPLISEGLSRMGDYQIEWPSFNQRVEKRRKTKVTKGEIPVIRKYFSY